MKRRPLFIVLSALTVACGGAAQPSAPTLTDPPLTGPHTLSGVVVATQDGAPAAGVAVKVNSTGSSTVTTGPNGEFRFDSVPDGTSFLELSAPGYLTRATKVTVTSPRSGVTLDIIRDAEPFSLGFYRQFARNGFSSAEALAALNPWTIAPSFYVRTVTDDTGDPVPPAVIEGVRRVIVNSVPELSADRFRVATFETGSEPRERVTGWVIVTFFRSFPRAGAIGDASVGGNSGFIRLEYDPDTIDRTGLGCEARTVAVADHEMVHSMGFWHTGPPSGGGSDFDFLSGPGCPGNGRKERTRYHAAVAYSRPPGNRDPDTDPFNFSLLRADGGMPPVVSCPAWMFQG